MWGRSSLIDKSNEQRFSLIHLRQLHKDLVDNKIITIENETIVVEILRELAEMVVYGDNKSELLFDFFCEKNMLSLFLEIMWVEGCPNNVHIQILQTLSILIKCVKNDTSLYYLLSNNYINEVIIFPHNLNDDESLRDQFASFIKSLSLRLDDQTVQFFFIEGTGAFPILAKAIEMLHITEPMVRTASQATILNVYKVDDKKAKQYSLQDHVMNDFFNQIVTLFEGHYLTLITICHEHLIFNEKNCMTNINDELELKTFCNHISDLFNSIQDWFYYLSDVYELGIAKLQINLTIHLMNEFILPTLLKPISEYSCKSQEGHNNNNTLQLNVLVSLTFLNQLLKIIQDPLLHRVITIALLNSNNNDEWKKIIEILLLQCDNETTSFDIISLDFDITNNDNNDIKIENSYRCGFLSIFHRNNQNEKLTTLALTIMTKLVDSLISNIWYKDNKCILADNICKFFNTINIDEVIDAITNRILKNTSLQTLTTIQICSFTMYSIVRIYHASQNHISTLESIRDRIRDAGRIVSKKLLQNIEDDHSNSESIVLMLQQEISRLHGQRWTVIAAQIFQEICLFSSSTTIGASKTTEADIIPIIQSEIIRKELQVFILIYSLIRHTMRLSLNVNEISTGDDLSLHLVDEILKIYNDSGISGKGYTEGQSFEMKGRRFLDAYFIDGARSPYKNNNNESSSSSISSMFGFSSMLTSKTSSSTPDNTSPSNNKRRISIGGKVSPPTTKSKANFGEILFVQNNYQLLLVTPETIGFSVVLVAPLLLTDCIIDMRDKRQLKILVRSWDSSVSYMTRVGPDERDSEYGEDIRNSITQSSLCLLKPRIQRSLWELTIAFETSQGCSLAAQHLTSKRESLSNDVKQHLMALLTLWSKDT